MPPGNDRKNFCLLNEWFRAPQQVLRNAWENGRMELDAQCPGQREFNGLLFRNLITPQMGLPWDRGTGRSFTALESYFDWVFAAETGYLIGASVPSRVVSYLLPFVATDASGATIVSGFPGLRLVEQRRFSYVLEHLPTGGKLEIFDAGRGIPDKNPLRRNSRELEREIRNNRRISTEKWVPAWSLPHLLREENLTISILHRPSALLSALSTRADLLWQLGIDMRLTPPTGEFVGLGTLTWERESRSSLSGRLPDISALLTGKLLGIPDLVVSPTILGGKLLTIGKEVLVVIGPNRTNSEFASKFRARSVTG